MQMSFDFPLEVTAIKFLAVFARAGAFTMAFSVFDGNNIPMPVKIIFGIMISLIMMPLVPVEWCDAAFVANLDMLKLTMLVLGEMLLGAGISLVVGCIMEIFNFGGSMIDMDIGFNSAQEVYTDSQENRSVIAGFIGQCFMVIFLAEDAHYEVIKLIAASFNNLEPGAFMVNQDVLDIFINMSAGIFSTGIQIALPALGTMLIVNIALGLLARIGEDFPVLMLSFPLKLGIGMIIVIAILPSVMGLCRGLNGELLKWMGAVCGVEI